ncbi:MAG: hypothetical protein HGA44_03655 [Cellulomonadaceae bacterium]|nr:hypothetical protein [Cellulomonadaceae bacterium]
METNDRARVTDDAADALASAADAEQRMATAVGATPWWYAPSYGVLIAMFVGASALHGAGQGIAAYLLLTTYLVGIGALVGIYQRSIGAWPGLRGACSRTVAAGFAVLLVVAIVVAHEAAGRWGSGWLAATSIVVGGLAGAAISRLSDLAWARDQRVR